MLVVDNGVLRTEGLGIAVSVLSAVTFALVAVYVSNNDTPHGLLRRIGLTRENSYPSEWYASFARNPDCHVVLHLQDERRLFGWPQEWPKSPKHGHFRIIEAEWLKEGGKDLQGEEKAEIFAIIVPVEDVKTVQFVKEEVEKE